MRLFIEVDDVLRLFPHRKKSWAYEKLREAKLEGVPRPALVSEFAILYGYSEQELRQMLGGAFCEAPGEK